MLLSWFYTLRIRKIKWPAQREVVRVTTGIQVCLFQSSNSSRQNSNEHLQNRNCIPYLAIRWSWALKKKYSIWEIKRPLKYFNPISILSRRALGPRGWGAVPRVTKPGEAEPGLGQGPLRFQLQCPPQWSLLLFKWSITLEFVFPWVQRRGEGSVEWC